MRMAAGDNRHVDRADFESNVFSSRYRMTPEAASRPKRAAARQNDRVDLLNAIDRVQEVGFLVPGAALGHRRPPRRRPR